MSLSIQDIQDKQFHVSFRGFNIEEVDAFLELVGENLSAVIEENKDLTRNVATLSQELDRIKKQENSFRNAIISAQKISEELKDKSQKEAETLLDKAHEEIKLLKDEAHCEVAELESRVDELRGMQSEFEKELHAVILSYQQKLNVVPTSEIHTLPEEKVSEPAESETSALEEEPDLTDLYEKIDMGDALGGGDSLLGHGTENSEEQHEDEARCIPDLDSDIMFTLHDPLDDGENPVDVVIERDKE